MIHYKRWLKSFSVIGNDGDLGKIEDVFFDQEKWTIRYIIVKSGKLLDGEYLYISPASIKEIDVKAETIRLNISEEQALKAPPLGEEPVTRQKETQFNVYHGMNPYWMGGGIWGTQMTPYELAQNEPKGQGHSEENSETKIHRGKNVIGYELSTMDNEFGRVLDIIFEEDTFRIRYFVVDTVKWIPGTKKVLISTDSIEYVDWITGQIQVSITEDQVKSAPEYSPDT